MLRPFLVTAALVATSFALVACGAPPARVHTPPRALAEPRAVAVIARTLRDAGLEPGASRDATLASGHSIRAEVTSADGRYGIAYLTPLELSVIDFAVDLRACGADHGVLCVVDAATGAGAPPMRTLVLVARDYVSDDELGDEHASTTIVAEARLRRDVRDFLVHALRPEAP